jgi:hypothetical protein
VAHTKVSVIHCGRDAQFFFRKARSHHTIPGARKVATASPILRTPQTSGATVKNAIALPTRRPGICTPVFGTAKSLRNTRHGGFKKT